MRERFFSYFSGRDGAVRMSFILLLSFLYYLSPANLLVLISPAMGDKQTLEFRYISGLESGTNRVLELIRGKLIDQNRSPHWRWKYWSPGNIGGWSYRRFHCIISTPAIYSLRASDSFRVAFLPSLHRSQVHIRRLCSNDKG